MDVTIQRAQKHDQNYIDERIRKDLLDPEDATWDKFFVTKYNEKTVAFGRVVDHGQYLEIASLGVDYYFRKKGIGTKMLNYLIQEAVGMEPAKDIYGVTHLPAWLEKAGFEEVPTGPKELEYKRHHKCKLDATKIKIMKLKEKL